MLIQFVLRSASLYTSTLRSYLCTNENKTGSILNKSVIKAYPTMQQSTDKHESRTFIQNSSMRYWLNPLSATDHAVDVYRPTCFFLFKMSSSWLFSSSMFPIQNIGSTTDLTRCTYILHYLYIFLSVLPLRLCSCLAILLMCRIIHLLYSTLPINRL